MNEQAPTPDLTQPQQQQQYAIEHGYLVEVTGQCTGGACGMGYGHEPTCGLQPLAPIEDLLADAALGARMRHLFAARPDTPCRTTRPDGPDGPECVEVAMADLREAFEPGSTLPDDLPTGDGSGDGSGDLVDF
ncbi:hypothetical protein [Nocardioides sp. Leaf285]|uniref:hypothetical protein n=1 Tax=Nocardioides sp. Leaf285 TaxID=1736322 RepID=UPI000703AC85|nr:hypothetical protein [Nocardioides sp. Leaf285]KQP63064.1 hypothetical protein ASF47_18815 [Nocardioides sp. Leaf285]